MVETLVRATKKTLTTAVDLVSALIGYGDEPLGAQALNEFVREYRFPPFP